MARHYRKTGKMRRNNAKNLNKISKLHKDESLMQDRRSYVTVYAYDGRILPTRCLKQAISNGKTLPKLPYCLKIATRIKTQE